MYYLVYGFIYLVSLLPLRVLFVIADGIWVLVYHVIKYRRDVVMHNLTIAFPEKSEPEKVAISKKFYHNLIDNFIETIKMLSASDAYLKKHCSGNFELVNELHKTGRSCNVLLGHNFNWELANHVVSLEVDYNFLVVYMPISNTAIDRLFRKLRSRGRTRLLSAHNMRRDMLPFRNEAYMLTLVADQNPPFPNRAYWLNFFGKPAPFVTGPEKSARAGDLMVLFGHIEKIKRGYYRFVISLADTDPKSQQEGEITVRYARYMEEVIRKDPSQWLWTHRRWKHGWSPAYTKLWVDTEPLPVHKKIS